jgi:hypothetical protein
LQKAQSVKIYGDKNKRQPVLSKAEQFAQKIPAAVSATYQMRSEPEPERPGTDQEDLLFSDEKI